MEAEFVALTEDGGIKKRIDQVGTGETPQQGNRCKV